MGNAWRTSEEAVEHIEEVQEKMKKGVGICKNHLTFVLRDKKHLFQKLLPIEKADTKKNFPMYASET